MGSLLRFAAIIAIVAVFRLAGIAVAVAGTLDPSFTDFEEAGFVDGNSVNDTAPDGTVVNITNVNNCVQAWRVGNAGPTTEDEEIVDISGTDPAHGQVWRLSQGGVIPTLGAAPHSPNNGNVSPLTAGETGAANDAGCGGPTTSNFYGELQFKSVTEATQAGLAISVQGSSHDQRHGFVRIFDDGSGFDLEFFETADGCTFTGTLIDTNLSYTDWHTLGIEIFFVDGLDSGTAGSAGAFGNDIVNIYVNGFLVHTGTSWESCVDAQSVDRLMFGSGGVIPGQIDGGLYFDNVLVTDVCPVGDCNLPVAFRNLGECISTLIDENCSGLRGTIRATCNKEQQNFCFDLFNKGREPH